MRRTKKTVTLVAEPIGGGGIQLHKQAHSLAKVNAAQSSAFHPNTKRRGPQSRILKESGNLTKSHAQHQGGWAGQKNMVGRERQRRHKARHAGPRRPL